MSESSEPAYESAGARLHQPDVNLLRIAAAFGAYCVVVLLVLIGMSNEAWDTLSTGLLTVAALIALSAWLCLNASRTQLLGARSIMRHLVRLAIGVLVLFTPVMALFFFWVSISMQMANTGLENYPLFAALCVGAVLLIAMQLLILVVGYRVRRRETEIAITEP